jgi:hypothetical protein
MYQEQEPRIAVRLVQPQQMQIEAEYVTVPKEVRERALEEADLIEREASKSGRSTSLISELRSLFRRSK